MFDSTSQIADQTVGCHYHLQHWPCSVTDFASAILARVPIARLPAGNTTGSARLQSGLFIPVHFLNEPNRIRDEPGPVPLVLTEGQRGLISGYQGIGGVIRRRKYQATKGALVRYLWALCVEVLDYLIPLFCLWSFLWSVDFVFRFAVRSLPALSQGKAYCHSFSLRFVSPSIRFYTPFDQGCVRFLIALEIIDCTI
jgi:hypothetical protein